MRMSLWSAVPVAGFWLVCLTTLVHSDEVLTCSNGKWQIGVSRQTGALVSLKSLQPTPLELLEPPEEPLLLTVQRVKGNEAVALKRVRRLKVDRQRVAVTVDSGEHPVAEAEVVYDLTGDFLRLTARVRWLAQDPGSYLVVWGQPSVPTQQLYSYPYSEGIASTGGLPFLRLGSSGSVMSRQTFPADAELDVRLTVLKHGLEPWTSVRYRMQPNGDGYHIFLAENGHKVSCWLSKEGQWVTAGGGLGSRDVEWSLGQPHRLRIVGHPEGFEVFLDEHRIFEIQDNSFVSGAIGIKQGYAGECRVHSVSVRSQGQTVLFDDFSTYPIGLEPDQKWMVRAGFVEVSDGGNEWGGYPARFLDLPDRYLVWGQFDLNRPVILNHLETKAPWVAVRLETRKRNPVSQFTFDLFLHAFPRPHFARRDAIRWYAQHLTHSDPFFKPAPVRLTHTRTRTFPEGNFACVWGAHSRLNPQVSDAEWARRAEKMKALRCTNIVLTDWLIIPWTGREGPPQDLRGAWFHPPTGRRYLAPFLRDEIARLHQEGFRVYLWCWPVTLFFNPRSEQKARAWVECIKQAVEFYQPDGIGYDMNWQVHKEILKLQYALFHWMQKRYPQKHIMHDYGFGTPSQLYAHSVLSEFGLWMYGVPHNDVIELFTALRTNLTNLVFFAFPLRELREKGVLTQIYAARVQVHTEQEWLQTYLQQVMQSVAMGGSWAVDSHDFDEPLFDEVLKRTALAEFAAKTTATPLV